MITKSSQKIFNNSLLYVLGTVLSKATYFLLIPIYTYNLTKDEYGIATTITTFVATFGIVAMLSLRAAIMRFYIDYTGKEKPKFIGTILITVMLNSVLLCLLLCCFKNLYADILFRNIPFYPYVFIGIISLGTEGVYLVYQSLLQAQQKGLRYSVNSILYLLTNAVLVALFLLGFDLKVLGVVLANLITNALFAIYGICAMMRHKEMVFVFDKKMFKKSIKYSLPILPHNLSNDLKTYSNKIIISNFLNYTLSGMYSLATQFSSMVNLVQSAINLAFRPWFVEQMGLGNEGRQQIKYMTQMIMSLFCFISVVVCVFSREIVMVFASKEYFDVWSIIPLFVFVQLITFIYYSHVQTLMYDVALSKFTFICSFIGLLTNIVVAIVLARPLGIYGIAIAQLLSKIVLSALVVIMNKKSENVDFGLKKMICSLSIAAILVAVSVFISFKTGNQVHLAVSLFIRFVLVIVAFGCYIFRYLKDYKVLFAGILHRKGNK